MAGFSGLKAGFSNRAASVSERLGKKKTLRGGQCRRSRMTPRRVIHGTSTSKKSRSPRTWCSRPHQVVQSWSLARARGSV